MQTEGQTYPLIRDSVLRLPHELLDGLDGHLLVNLLQDGVTLLKTE